MMSNQSPQPDERVYQKPVAWLFGRQFIANFKWALLYSAFGTKLDPRDWMEPKVYPTEEQERAGEGWQAREGEFWFDYLSDTGDGVTATYSIAYLTMSDLWVREAWNDKPADERAQVTLSGSSENSVRLPRGEFLFIGGDTTYHLSDYATLATRFQKPFTWAYHDLKEDGGLRDAAPRPIFGIPGNHDYYDMLDGFRRQFRHPIREEAGAIPLDRASPQLMLPGFHRQQESSYVALRLPFGWWMWGLDTEVGAIDERQKRFFRTLNGGRTPEKLIVATCAPTTVFGKTADADDEKSVGAFCELGLAQPFLPRGKEIPEGQCRLDLSGDIHHYARYWGPQVNEPEHLRPRHEKGAKQEAPSASNYASVVSGMGGAFLHPSETYVGGVREQALYPREEVSRRAVAGEIFKFWNVWNGGSIWLAGFIMAFVVYFGSTIVLSSRQAVENFPPFNWLGITRPVAVVPAVPSADILTDARGPAAATTASEAARYVAEASRCSADGARYFWGPCAVRAPAMFKAGLALAFLSLAIVVVGFALRRRLFGPPAKVGEATTGQSNTAENVNRRLWALVISTTIVAALSIVLLRLYRGNISPFGNSMVVLLTIIWAVAATLLNLRYSEWLFEKVAQQNPERQDWTLSWVLAILTVVSLTSGIWIFGRNNLTAYLLVDIIFTLVVSLTLILLVLMGAFKGGELQNKGGKALMALVGLWHALLQLLVPFLLIRKGSWLALAAAAILIFVMMKVGEHLRARDMRAALVVAWVAYGAAMLLLPYVVWRINPDAPTFAVHQWWAGFDGWAGLVPALLAGIVGAVMCCVWFGWYLGVSLSFNGHNNEAGGAARIERFKEFIRIRVTENDLTAYVIAVDEPRRRGRELQPKIIDVIHLTARRSV